MHGQSAFQDPSGGRFCRDLAGGRTARLEPLHESLELLFSKGFLLRFIRDFLAGRRRSETEHFQLETSDSGIVFSAIGATSSGLASSQKQWSDFRAYCQTPDIFVLALGRAFYVVPKRSLTAARTSEFQAILSSKLPQVTIRTGIRAVRHAVSRRHDPAGAVVGCCAPFKPGERFGPLPPCGFPNPPRPISYMALAKFMWSRSEIRRR